MVKKETGEIESPTPKKKAFRGDVHDLVLNAAVAAIYFALTAALAPIGYGAVQFRISEILVLLAFWRKDLTIGLTLGCIFANVYGSAIGSVTPWDILIGSGATLVSCLLMSFASPRLFVAALWPILLNGIAIGAELTWLIPAFPEFWQNALSVAAGEAIVMVIAYVIFLAVCRNQRFFSLLKPNCHASILY